jgi:hypothetical protein
MVRLLVGEAHPRAFGFAKKAVCASSAGPERLAHLAKMALLFFDATHDPVEVTECIVAAVEAKGGYPIGG